jgi:predicted PurR-regulated permease PerM
MRTNGARRDTAQTDAATPIWISRRTRQALVVAGVATLALVLWRVPTLVSLCAGGVALAVALSFPVRTFSRVMPRSAAIASTILLAAALIGLVITVFAPIIVDQLRALVAAVPGIAGQLDARVPSVLDSLTARGLLPGTPEHVLADMQQRLLVGVQQFAGRLLGGLGSVVTGVVGVVVALLGIMLVAVYLLVDARRIQAGLLRASPHRYRRDMRALWNAFGETLSRYLAGLALSIFIEGTLAAILFHLLGVPYAFLLGAWVSVTAVIPYVGAWLGYTPGVLLALAISPTRALLTLLLCLLNNLVVGNVISPRIQGRAVRVHPMLAFFAVITGGALFGMPGVVLAVPAMAVLRVLYDFLRVRVRVVDESPASDHPTTAPRDDRRYRAAIATRDAPSADLSPIGPPVGNP